MPGVTGDVVNDAHSHTPFVAEVLVCLQLSHTLDVTREPVYSQSIHILAGGMDRKLYARISKSELSLLRKDAHIGKEIRQ